MLDREKTHCKHVPHIDFEDEKHERVVCAACSTVPMWPNNG